MVIFFYRVFLLVVVGFFIGVRVGLQLRNKINARIVDKQAVRLKQFSNDIDTIAYAVFIFQNIAGVDVSSAQFFASARALRVRIALIPSQSHHIIRYLRVRVLSLIPLLGNEIYSFAVFTNCYYCGGIGKTEINAAEYLGLSFHPVLIRARE